MIAIKAFNGEMHLRWVDTSRRIEITSFDNDGRYITLELDSPQAVNLHNTLVRLIEDLGVKREIDVIRMTHTNINGPKE